MPSVSMDSPRFEVLQDGFIYGCFPRLHFALVFADVLCGRQWNPTVDQVSIYDRESGWIKEREPMINHHNAPSYAYLGFTYKPIIEHEDDDGIRKATHYVHRNGHDRHEFIVHASPYRWLTLDAFQHAVDMHCDGVPFVTEDEVQDQYLADGLKTSTLVTVITELANGSLSPSEFRKFILSEVEDGND